MVTRSCKYLWQTKTLISSTTIVSVTTKPCRMVNCRDGFLPRKSHDPLITWSGKIMWQTKTIIFTLPIAIPMDTKLGRVLTYHERLPPIKLLDPIIAWSCKIKRQNGLARSRDKLKPLLYLNYHCLWSLDARLETYPEGLLSYSLKI